MKNIFLEHKIIFYLLPCFIHLFKLTNLEFFKNQGIKLLSLTILFLFFIPKSKKYYHKLFLREQK